MLFMGYFFSSLAIMTAVLAAVKPEAGPMIIASGLMVGGILGLLPKE